MFSFYLIFLWTPWTPSSPECPIFYCIRIEIATYSNIKSELNKKNLNFFEKKIGGWCYTCPVPLKPIAAKAVNFKFSEVRSTLVLIPPPPHSTVTAWIFVNFYKFHQTRMKKTARLGLNMCMCCFPSKYNSVLVQSSVQRPSCLLYWHDWCRRAFEGVSCLFCALGTPTLEDNMDMCRPQDSLLQAIFFAPETHHFKPFTSPSETPLIIFEKCCNFKVNFPRFWLDFSSRDTRFTRKFW